MEKISDGQPREFRLEKYFARHGVTEFSSLANSDVQPLKLGELLEMADAECRELWDNMSLSYTYAIGDPMLRREVAKFHDVTQDEIMITTGHEGIYIAFRCLLTYLKAKHNLSKLEVVTTFPAYQSLYEVAQSIGCEVKPWIIRTDKTTGWDFRLEDLKAAVTANTKLLVINFPHNPTGFIPSRAVWDELIRFCKSREIFLFSDEMYRLTNNDGSKPLPSACSLYEEAITVFGMSKTFACPGLRLAWLCTKNDQLMAMMTNLKDYITICPSRPSEILAIIALRNEQRLRQRTLAIVRENLDALDEFFQQHTDIFRWFRPTAGTTGFVKLQGWALNLDEGGAYGFCENLVRETGILLLPAKLYYFSDNYIRVGFGYQNIPKVLRRFQVFLDNHAPASSLSH